MQYKQFIIIIVAFLFLFSANNHKPLNAQGNEAVSAVVKNIEFKGNNRISSSTVKAAIKTNVGDFYDPQAISQDVDAIWLLGFL